jgi:NAD(P)-dependent dehydrogenase (short-subunit alcohol dehydrogenase family)
VHEETTRALAKAGASVTVGARDPDRAASKLAGIERVEIGQLDLLDPTSVDAFAARYLDSGRPLHILINNAGIMGGPLVRDARGYESQFVTNHLGHFQLTLGLLPALRAGRGARVVNVTSGGHRLSDIRWDDPHFTTGYDPMLGYGQSKTANVLFAVELDRRWAADGIRGYAVHPGVIIGTDLGPSRPEDGTAVTEDQQRAMGLIDDSGQPIIDPDRGTKTPQQGCQHQRVRRDQPATGGHRRCLPEGQRHFPAGHPEAHQLRHRARHPGRRRTACRRPRVGTATLGPERAATQGVTLALAEEM